MQLIYCFFRSINYGFSQSVSIKWKLYMRHLIFRILFTALIKADLRRAVIVKLEIRSLFKPKATHSLAVLMILLVRRSLLTSEISAH